MKDKGLTFVLLFVLMLSLYGSFFGLHHFVCTEYPPRSILDIPAFYGILAVITTGAYVRLMLNTGKKRIHILLPLLLIIFLSVLYDWLLIFTPNPCGNRVDGLEKISPVRWYLVATNSHVIDSEVGKLHALIKNKIDSDMIVHPPVTFTNILTGEKCSGDVYLTPNSDEGNVSGSIVKSGDMFDVIAHDCSKGKMNELYSINVELQYSVPGHPESIATEVGTLRGPYGADFDWSLTPRDG